MPKRRGASLGILVAAQAAYLVLAAVYLWTHGVPAFGEGRSNPYLAYLALNSVTFPLAVLLLPVVFTIAVRQRITERTGRLLREVWANTLVTMPVVALLFEGFAEGRLGHLVYRIDRPIWFLLGEGFVFLLLADLWFYATHRALHSRLLYRYHKAHHAHVAPTEAATFLALSAAELCISGLLMLSFPLLLIPVHVHVAVACSGIILLFGFFIHEDALMRAPVPPLVNGPLQHQVHHGRARANVNYSLMFTFFDRLFGTYEAPTARRS
jgi:sterol desaturase/sphingolipid hydroxylase (fatty acid hydroxylase superfamily)